MCVLSGGHALRAGAVQSLSPLVSPSEGEFGSPLEALNCPRGVEELPQSSSSSSHAALPLRDKSGLAEFVPMLTQGWAQIFIRRPSGQKFARVCGEQKRQRFLTFILIINLNYSN